MTWERVEFYIRGKIIWNQISEGNNEISEGKMKYNKNKSKKTCKTNQKTHVRQLFKTL